MNVYKVSDCDWYAAESFEEAAAFAVENQGIGEDSLYKEGEPLTEAELREMVIADWDDGPNGLKISGWEHLQNIINGGVSPAFFSSTEY